ncbi:uncharacterized protein LOC123322803 [Coccinella septempunctata]|uniref:uncharacterized protein LOC123322803 n=1 Tax=Coccinella septempunctata TaxID=41139 RepID=UPI001D07A6B3|nr:uncharacterized protein LOC123322803 [Coccinella septempunctata]
MIVISRTRVAPMKELSIPRLELQGAILGSRIAASVTRSLEIPINRVCFWTDSMCVLGWIRDKSNKYKQFVSNRVAEIRASSDVDQWRWVPTSENPADLATRQAPTKPDMEFWMHGPQFLRKSKQYWPQEDTKLVEKHQSTAEEKFERCLVIQEIEFHGLLPEIKRGYCKVGELDQAKLQEKHRKIEELVIQNILDFVE